MTALVVLGWAVLVLLALLALLLALPIRLRFRVEADPRPRAFLRVALLGGAVPEFSVFDSRWPRKPKPERKEKKPERRKSGGARLVPGILDLIGDILGCIRLVHLRAEAAFGHDDPAVTGQLYGLMTPFLFGTRAGRPGAIQVQPVFDRACFEGWAEGCIALTPAALIPPGLRFVWRQVGARGGRTA